MTEKQNCKKILYAASTASHLQRFHQPYIEALRGANEVVTMAQGEGVDRCIRFEKSLFSFSNLFSILKIRKILKRERFDRIILHTTLAAFLIRAAMLGWKRRPFVINVVHGYLFPLKPRGMRDRLLLLCEKMVRGKTDVIVVMNEEDLQIAQSYRLCKGSIREIRGMGLPLTDTVPQKDVALYRRYAQHATPFICTFVGELSHRKNQIFLIRAAKRLLNEGIPIKLLLIGEGSDREELEQEVQRLHLERHVLFTGTQSPVLPYLSITDLYVSASISEGLPFNVMEAMSCGLPIVASATKGQTDLLGAASDCLYPLDDEDAFCDAVRHTYATGRYGVGSCKYPWLEKYRLSSVFDENMKIWNIGNVKNECID